MQWSALSTLLGDGNPPCRNMVQAALEEVGDLYMVGKEAISDEVNLVRITKHLFRFISISCNVGAPVAHQKRAAESSLAGRACEQAVALGGLTDFREASNTGVVPAVRTQGRGCPAALSGTEVYNTCRTKG